ncbi:MAG: malate synthase A [Myxococcota bacterium]
MTAHSPTLRPPAGMEILAPAPAELFTAEAMPFLVELARRFGPRVEELLLQRRDMQRRYDAGERPDFLAETAELRASDWTVAAPPADLRNRRVEITGPVDRKMIINALNSGANVYMADFEDSHAPTWDNNVQGQLNLRDAVRATIRYQAPEGGKVYALKDSVATLMVRPRGWHLPERNVRVDGRAMPASLFDFGLFFFHNARHLTRTGRAPYFYLPKLESHLEARLWNDVFLYAQAAQGIPRGTIRATVLIETLPAAFRMDEILYELREHSAGLNCGRWDYIFSTIKKLRKHPGHVMPDRAQVTMEQPCMRAYTQLVVRTCHRRGAHAMGGMAAQIPIRHDERANEAALAKVRADKLREVKDGHDGTWVAHPGLVPVARQIFDEHMPGENQLQVLRDDVTVTREELLQVPRGARTEAGLRHNVRVGIQYLEAWLRGQGCVPLYNLMEDAATAEISRAQVWQWIHHRAPLDNGMVVTPAALGKVMVEEMETIRQQRHDGGERFADACRLFEQLCTTSEFEEFLTLPAYDLLTARASRP